MPQWLNGRALADKILTELKTVIARLDFQPCLAAISVGNNPSSTVYLRLKENACQKVGLNFEPYYFVSATQAELLKLIQNLNSRPEINGILLQLPLPEGLDPDPLITAIDPAKDVDGFHPQNQLALANNHPSVVSPLLRGAGELLKTVLPDPSGKEVLVVAKSQIFAQGATDYFKTLGCSVKTHLFKSGATPSQNENATKIAIGATKKPDSAADIIFTAIGRPGCLADYNFQPGAIVLDAGFTHIDGHPAGGLDPKTAENPNIAYATPVPGGLGPLTVAMLLQNTYDLSQKQKLPA